MIRASLLIGGFLIALLAGLWAIWQIRGYLRTGMKTYLYWGVGGLVVFVSLLGMPIVGIIFDLFGGRYGEYIFIIIGGAMLVTAYYFQASAGSMQLYDERDEWEQMWAKTTYWQRLTGNLPIVEQKKPRSLPISKRSGLILGIVSTTLGTIVTAAFVLFKVTMVLNIFIVAPIALILGLLLIIFSILCLDMDNRRLE